MPSKHHSRQVWLPAQLLIDALFSIPCVFVPLPSLALFTASQLYGIPTSVARYRVQLVTL